jgi:hypothetical protein
MYFSGCGCSMRLKNFSFQRNGLILVLHLGEPSLLLMHYNSGFTQPNAGTHLYEQGTVKPAMMEITIGFFFYP